MVRGMEGSASLMLVSGVAHVDPQRGVFEGMLKGWGRQQLSRSLAESSVRKNVSVVRQFAEFTNDYPWQWSASDVEEFWTHLRSEGRSLSTLRAYQIRLRQFCDFLTDPRYEWVTECEARFGTHPVQICHEWNTATHTSEYEGDPRRRPFTREELQTLFDHAD